MGYHITLRRPEPQPQISEQEWRDFAVTRPELRIIKDSKFITAIVNGDENIALHYADGSIFTKNPDGPRIIKYMASIASHFGGVVSGDEGEPYATEADWGTEADWAARPSPIPWWKRELPRGMRILIGIFLGLILFAIQEVLISN